MVVYCMSTLRVHGRETHNVPSKTHYSVVSFEVCSVMYGMRSPLLYLLPFAWLIYRGKGIHALHQSVLEVSLLCTLFATRHAASSQRRIRLLA